VNNQREMEHAVGSSQLATLLYNTRCGGLRDKRSGIDRSTLPAGGETYPFLPGLVEYSLTQHERPTTQQIAVLFVDLADSTHLMLHHPSEKALALVQCFMRLVTDVALAHCGDVKDYEGDGALLYFGSVAQATRAALAIRAALMTVQTEEGHALQARFSVNAGEVIVAVIGSPLRRSVALLGPTVSLAARLLKHVSPGGIIAPLAAVEQLRGEAPELAVQFQRWGEELLLKGFEEARVSAAVIPDGPTEIGAEPCPGHVRYSGVPSGCHPDRVVSASLPVEQQ
jgi:class 3 adenylate cyclase